MIVANTSVSCAGWVCYAEKTHGEWILPYLCTAKSPQAVAGTLIKGGALQANAASDVGVSPTQSVTPPQPAACCRNSTEGASSAGECDTIGSAQVAGGTTPGDSSACVRSIYHVAIMPCYDKKLEAAPSDLTSHGGG